MSSRNALRALAALTLCFAAAAPAADRKDETAIANEGGIRDKWMLADGVPLAAPGYPAEFAPALRNVCIALGYRNNPDGTTSDFQVVKQWNSAAEDKVVYGIPEPFVEEVGGMVRPGQSALFILAESDRPLQIAENVRGYGGMILRTTLRPEVAKELQRVIDADRPVTR